MRPVWRWISRRFVETTPSHQMSVPSPSVNDPVDANLGPPDFVEDQVLALDEHTELAHEIVLELQPYPYRSVGGVGDRFDRLLAKHGQRDARILPPAWEKESDRTNSKATPY